MNAKQALFAALRWLPATGIPSLARRRFGGIGTIFTLHSVVRDKTPSFSFLQDMELSESFVDSLLRDYRARGYHIASMDEVRSYLDGGPRPDRFVAFTFDDGYRNNWDTVLPLFERHRAPFIVYLATDMIDGKRLPWSYGLQDAIRSRASLTAELEGGTTSISLRSEEERAAAFDRIDAFAAALDLDARDAWFMAFFRANDLEPSEITSRHMMSWDMARDLAASGFASIGAHTVAHAALKPLGRERMEREVDDSRKRIEEELELPVRHFSYPFGGYDQVGRRDIDYVTSRGWQTAVTTRSANVFLGHRSDPCALPRQPLSGVVEDLGIVHVLDSGLPTALLYGPRRVVTDSGGLKRFL